MLRRETGRDDRPSVKVKVFNQLRYGLSKPETACADNEAN